LTSTGLGWDICVGEYEGCNDSGGCCALTFCFRSLIPFARFLVLYSAYTVGHLVAEHECAYTVSARLCITVDRTKYCDASPACSVLRFSHAVVSVHATAHSCTQFPSPSTTSSHCHRLLHVALSSCLWAFCTSLQALWFRLGVSCSQLSTINSCQSLASGVAWLGRCEA